MSVTTPRVVSATVVGSKSRGHFLLGGVAGLQAKKRL